MKTALDYMTGTVVTLSPDKSVLQAIEIMKENDIGSVLIAEENGKISGIFTERDLLNKIDFNSSIDMRSLPVKDYMTKDPLTVPGNEEYMNVIEIMKEKNIRHMLVTGDNKVIGIISLRDILKEYSQELENILKKREKELYDNIRVLKESEEKFHTIFDNSAVAIIFVDKDENIIAWNPFVEDLLGMGENGLRNKPIKDIYPLEEWERIRAQNIRRLGMRHHLETKVITGSGKTLDVDVSISILKDPEGNVTGSIGIMRDISERKRLEQLREEFVAAISHELRTPLAATKEGLSQVLDGILGDINEDQRATLSVVLSEMNRLHRVLDNLLDISKLESGWFVIKREYVDMISVAEKVVVAFTAKAKEKGVELKTRYSSGMIKGYADEDKITQVFTNLLNNALKFTRKGSIEIFVEDSEKSVVCGVSDTGVGISEEDLPNVFNKFSQFGKIVPFGEKGTGLGLSICKGIIELHKGEIWIESKIGVGSSFKFSLPKFTVKELFREYLRDSLQDAVRKGRSLSVITYGIKDVDKAIESMGGEKVASLGQNLEDLVRRNLHRDDIVVNDACGILTVLPNTEKKKAMIVAERIKKLISEYLALEGWNDRVEFTCRVSGFPSDGRTIEEVLNSGKDV